MWDSIVEEFSDYNFKNQLEETFITKHILSAESLPHSISSVLANKISNEKSSFNQFFALFLKAYEDSGFLKKSIQLDLQAVIDRDFACETLSAPLLYFNGFHGLQLQRLAHFFYKTEAFITSSLIHERMVSCCSMDIHPAVSIGSEIVIDHGIGVVIGETAKIGNNVFMYHNVTLGSSGASIGNRHPVIEDDVLLGSNCTVLGNITVGKGSVIAAGSIVTKPVPANVLMAGNPAKEVGPAKQLQKK